MEQHNDDKPGGRVLSRREMLALLGSTGITVLVGSRFKHLDFSQINPTATLAKGLRGYQVTDDSGVAEFITIYPGWYSGRTVHIHFKIRTEPESEQGYEFTSQLFFPEELSDLVHAQPPYTEKGYRDTPNEDDNIFQNSEGLLTLDLVELEDEAGYSATFTIGLDLSDLEQGDDDSIGTQGSPGGTSPGGARPRGTPPAGSPASSATPMPR